MKVMQQTLKYIQEKIGCDCCSSLDWQDDDDFLDKGSNSLDLHV